LAQDKCERIRIVIGANLPLRILWKGISAPNRAKALSIQTCTQLLPTITAVAAISAIATPPATASMTSPPTSTPAAPAAAKSAPAAAALCLGTCLIHHQVSPTKVLPVQGIDRAFRIFVCVYFHKGEAARLARETVTNQIDC
jgi:hypothetical protein